MIERIVSGLYGVFMGSSKVKNDFEIDMFAIWVSMIRHLFGGKRLPTVRLTWTNFVTKCEEKSISRLGLIVF